MLAHHRPQAASLAADHQGQGRGQLDIVKGGGALLAGQAVQPDIFIPQTFHGPGQVGYLAKRQVGKSAGGGLFDHAGHRAGAVPGNDHAVTAGGIGAAQNGAEIVRIGDAVEKQQERRSFLPQCGGEQVIELNIGKG